MKEISDMLRIDLYEVNGVDTQFIRRFSFFIAKVF